MTLAISELPSNIVTLDEQQIRAAARAAWQKEALEAFRAAPNYETANKYLLRVESHERALPLWHLLAKRRMSQPDRNKVLAEWWNCSGYPSELGTRTVVDLFKDVGFVADTPGVERPTTPLTIYRGCHRGGKGGVCWTTDLLVAQFFAFRHTTRERVVYSATVPPHGVLGLFESRGEAEVVVNPRTLCNVIEMKPLSPEEVGRVMEQHNAVLQNWGASE